MKTLRGRGVVAGVAEGIALVSQERISVNLGINEQTGIVVERGHDLEGQSVAGKILVFKGEKGSGSSSLSLFQLVRLGLGPLAIINSESGAIIAAGAALAGIPLVHRFDSDPLAAIRTGDHVCVDASTGIVQVTQQEGVMS